MNPNIVERINELKNDKLHGANWLSVQAKKILHLAIQDSKAITITEFINELQRTATVITEARQNMISIANYTTRLLNRIIVDSQGQRQLASVKNIAQGKVNEFIKLIQETPLKAAENAAKIITDQDTIITCSYSSTVCNTFKVARGRTINFKVIIAESTHNNLAYGRISAEQLKQYQITVTVIPDEAMHRYVAKADKALVGTDTILTNGSLINGIPTYQLAQAASTAKIPFYAVCETAKFDVRNQYLNKPALEPGFDLIPASLITGIITEAGIIESVDVAKYILKGDTIA